MQENRITVKCPYCDWRILDKITPATGVIELKCSKCKNVIALDLAHQVRQDYKDRLIAYVEKIATI